MHERIRFISHQGKQILLVDLSNCSSTQVERIARTVPDYVTVPPFFRFSCDGLALCCNPAL
jgi:hypothetical protein